jgi:hypothetical protein
VRWSVSQLEKQITTELSLTYITEPQQSVLNRCLQKCIYWQQWHNGPRWNWLNPDRATFIQKLSEYVKLRKLLPLNVFFCELGKDRHYSISVAELLDPSRRIPLSSGNCFETTFQSHGLFYLHVFSFRTENAIYICKTFLIWLSHIFRNAFQAGQHGLTSFYTCGKLSYYFNLMYEVVLKILYWNTVYDGKRSGTIGISLYGITSLHNLMLK